MARDSAHTQLPLAVLAIATSLLYVVFRRFRARGPPLPPSPSSDPFIGHLRKVPNSNEHQVYAQWGKELNSDIISVFVRGRTLIILNSARAVNDLLERRSTIYSSRPQEPMTSYPDLIDWSKRTGRLPYGERWRSQRRLTHAFMHKKASARFWPSMVKQARLALHRLLTNPETFVRELRRMTGATMMWGVYGYEVTPTDDHFVNLIESSVDHLCQATLPSNFIVNTMPMLRYVPDWFPGTEWKQTVKAWRDERDEAVNAPFNWTKEQIANGNAPHSVLKEMLARLEANPDLGYRYAEEEDMIKWTAASVFGAGTDPTAATTTAFILAMVLNQDVLAKAQAEVDRVVGRDRLPEMCDRDSLPYVECVIKEVLRWQPVTPLSLVHETSKADEYKGYCIPKGAHVVGNIWAISYNESVYPEPEQFNPDRFLNPKTPAPPGFGFGRRSCPGNHIAEATLFITIASLLSVFNMRPAKDKDGQDIIPEVNMKSNAIIGCLDDFDCSITPRSEKTIELLNTTVLELP